MKDINEKKAEALDKLIPALLAYNDLRDQEWEFEDRAGDRDMWDKDDIEEHDELLDDISAKRGEIREILREVTGNPNLNF